ncbi:hypothetical protein KR084_005034 [Drosophila pseudotakahashii]|nr:hypothetical protein KR084_005034 [Drosophila pseudotakahashii]
MPIFQERAAIPRSPSDQRGDRHRPRKSGSHRRTRTTRAHVRRCEICKRFKPNQMQAAGKMLTQVPEEPWATVCADFVGPLPRSKHGNQMLLVLIEPVYQWTVDQWTVDQWTELVPLRSATA